MKQGCNCSAVYSLIKSAFRLYARLSHERLVNEEIEERSTVIPSLITAFAYEEKETIKDVQSKNVK